MLISRRALLKGTASAALATTAGGLGSRPAFAWAPSDTVELVVPTGPGSTIDLLARTIHQIWAEQNLLPVKSTVNNREGGGHVVYYNYMASKRGKPNVVGIASSNLIVNNLAGRMAFTHDDFSPIAMMVNGAFYALAVPADSPIKSAAQYVETMKKDPAALSIGIGSALGASQHIAYGIMMQTAGVPDIKTAKIVNFSDSSGVVPAVLGKHVDIGLVSAGNAAPHAEAGKFRLLATTGAQRGDGVFKDVPTWEELGYKGSVIGSWRGLLGTQGMTEEQIAFWDDVVRTTMKDEKFKSFAQSGELDLDYRGPADFRAFLDGEFKQLKSVMDYIGVKPK